jgi:hypothetical protein
MQSLTIPTGVHNPNGHSSAAVLAGLRAATGSRRWSFRYDLLTSANVFVQALDCVLGCTIEQEWHADIKRSARFTIRDTGEINYLQDRIQPWARLHLPPWGADDWVEWPLGVFGLVSPTRTADASAVVTREVDGYDGLQTFADDRVDARYTVAAGTAYTTAVATLLGSITTNITASAATLPVAREWDPGTPKLKIINELLAAVNYESLSFDEHGVAVVKPYTSPQYRPEEYVYADGADSIMLPEVEQTLDLFSVPNQWVLVVSDPDQAALTSTYTNSDPASPTSTVSRQRTIVDFRTEQDAADQATLDAKAARLAFEASQVYEAIGFETGLMPIHSGNDVYRIRFSPLAVDAKYVELSWSVELRAGAAMSHRVRRAVSV